MKFVVMAAVLGAIGWAIARWASSGTSASDDSFAASYVRESAQIFGVMAVLAIVVGLPVVLAVELVDGAVVPILVAAAMTAVGLAVVSLLGRRFPESGLPTAEHWRRQLGDELARPGVPLALAFIVIAALGMAIIAS